MPFIYKLCFIILIMTLSACGDKSANDYLISAQKHLKEQNQSAAIIDLKNAIKIAPSQAEARFLLGKIYLAEKRYESAEKELNRALTYQYPAAEVIPLLSQAYQKTGADNALTELTHKQMGLTAAQVAQVSFYKLQAFANLAQTEKAQVLVTEIKSLDTDSPFKSLSLVYALLLNDSIEKKIPAAILQLDNILESSPVQPDALKLKANLLMQQQEPELALVVFRQYHESYPDDLELSFIFARLLTDFNQTEEAEPIIDQLLAINDSNMLLNQLKGVARFNAKDSKNALLYTEKAINLNPEDSALRLVAGISAYLEKNFQAAHQHLSFIADKLPPSHQALRLLAASQLQLGLNIEANETLKQFDNITSNDASLFSSVGLALIQSGEVTKAKALLNNAPDAEENVNALARLGMLQLSLNDVEGIINLESALDKISTTPESSNAKKVPQQLSIEKTLATAYIASKAYDKALALSERWKVENPKELQAYALAALVYMKQNNIEKAQNEFKQALLISPNDPKSQMGLIELNEHLSPKANNEAAINTLLNTTPDFIPALIKLYLYEQKSPEVLNKSQMNNGIKRIQEVSKQQPENAAIKIILAKIYLLEKRYTDAVTLLSDFEDTAEKPTLYWQILGESYVQLKQFKQAKKHYIQWLSAKPNDRDAVIGNILTMDAEGNYQEALSLAQQYLDKKGGDLKVQLLHSYLLVMNNDFEAAKNSYNQLPENVQNIPFAKGILGTLQLQNNNYAQAITNLHSAYKVKPSARNVRLIYLCYIKLEQKQNGLQFLMQHVKNNPQDQNSLMQLANEQLQYDIDSSVNNYQKAVAINNNNGVAHNNLAFLYMEKGQLKEAKQHAEQALILMPEDPNTLDTFAQILLKNNDHEGALIHLSKAVTQEKVVDEVYVNYIEALLLNSQIELAKRKITQRNITNKTMQKRMAILKKKYQL